MAGSAETWKAHVARDTANTVEAIKRDVLEKLFCNQGKFPAVASKNDYYLALAYVVRDRLMHRWISTVRTYFERASRTVAYLSAEFLTGPQLGNTLVSLGIHDQARQAVAEARYPDALAHARACLRVRPSSAEAHLLVARVERLTGNFPEAEHHLNECVRLQQGASEATQLEWVLLRAQGGEVDVVAPGLLACVEQGHPETPMILETLAWAYIRQMRFRPALACLNRLLTRGPDTAHVLDWRGLVHERLALQRGFR